MNTNNFLKKKPLKFFIVISFILIILAAGCVILITYMKYYKNPSEQNLIEAGIEEKTVKVGNVDFNYVEGQNNGPALLLLHAQTLDWFTYSKVLPVLSKEFHIFAVDYPGHGKTIYPEIKQTIADRLFTASYQAVQDKQYGGNFLDYWIENGTDFFRTYE
jgi:hypothetical protein